MCYLLIEIGLVCRGDDRLLVRNIKVTDYSDNKYSLGYGDEQKLIVLLHNVPTTTLPIFWKEGFYKGKRWFPLFPRREKVQI